MRRPKTELQLKPSFFLVLALVLCCVLMFLSFRYKDKFEPIRSLAGNLVVPMQKGINGIGRGLSGQAEKLADLEELLAENNALKEKINTLEYENKILLQNKYELDNFRELYSLDQNYADYPKVAARVVANSSNNWYSDFWIDKGSKDGIKKDMNVLSGNGLVGIITEVGPNWSKVRSIINDSSYVSGMFIKSSDVCLVKGDLELLEKGYISVEGIFKDAKIEDGYEIVTSYLSDKYHPGILIGYISNIKTAPSNMTKTGYLTPAVDFSSLDMVLIITKPKEVFSGIEQED